MTAGHERFIATDGVSKTYNPRRADQVRAVDAVTMHVDRGEVLVLEGPSGSGKTSLLSLIGCMSRPTAGRIVVDGRDVAKLAESELTLERRQRFGFIFQQFHLIADLPVIENVLVPLYPTEMSLRWMAARLRSAIRSTSALCESATCGKSTSTRLRSGRAPGRIGRTREGN